MSNLVLHNPKFAAKLTSFEDIAALPHPEPMGPNHKPVPHARLIETFRQEIARRDYAVEREAFALGRNGAALFGVIDLKPNTVCGTDLDIMPETTRGLSFGFRNSTDRSLGIRGVAGTTVFVCDNLALSGSEFVLSRKNTTGLDIGHAVMNGFDRFITQARTFNLEIRRMQTVELDDEQAKLVIYDLFAARVIQARLFDDVDNFYFRPHESRPDCAPRTLWGLHNAVTRAQRDLTPMSRFGSAVALGRAFEELTDRYDPRDVVDAEAVEVQ